MACARAAGRDRCGGRADGAVRSGVALGTSAGADCGTGR